MNLTIFSHKLCWPSNNSSSGYATDGGFPFQMQALSELFESTTVVVPCLKYGQVTGETQLVGNNLTIVPLSQPLGKDLLRKLLLPTWLLQNFPKILHEVWRADAVHTPIPSDIGTIGMLLAFVLRKPLFVRHCGTWKIQRTVAERFWHWYMEQFASSKHVMLATGGDVSPPSPKNPNIKWIFASSVTMEEITACSTGRSPRSEDAGYRLITVCRQEIEKGTDIVIRSLSLLVDIPYITLDIVGTGGAIPTLKLLVESLQLVDRVRFHGKLDHNQVLQILKQSDLFCYPTQAFEGFPKVVLEALACGVPVITTRISVLPLLIEQGCGILLSEPAPTDLAQSIRKCIFDEKMYQSMSEQAIMVAKQYSLEHWRDEIGAQLQSAWGVLRSND
ncbi:glycosyltransferase family 4 protein [Patescibacteria group bacterium]|nr:glycosyltransferase family 4 protein [Patescibacteria group bacterium]